MTYENEFYTIAFLKAFGKTPEVYADRESALLWQIASEKSVTEADTCYSRLKNDHKNQGILNYRDAFFISGEQLWKQQSKISS